MSNHISAHADDARTAVERLRDFTEEQEELLARAWEMGARSMGSVYYSLDLPTRELPGDRPWLERWSQLRDAFDFRGRRVLELGANMGLLSMFALVEGAEAAIAADRDRSVLRAGQVAASALDVFPTFVHCDVAYSPMWEDTLLSHTPDVMFLLNVIHWVEGPERLMRFCAQFDELVVEDHEPFEVARDRFRAIGFDEVRLVGTTEIDRPLFVARRG